MLPLSLALVLAAAEPDDNLSKKMLPIYVREVETYKIAAESEPEKPLELKKEPVFEWLNPARNTQQGAIFLWLREGRPAALACISNAGPGLGGVGPMASYEGLPTASKWILSATMWVGRLEVVTVLALLRGEVLRGLRWSGR